MRIVLRCYGPVREATGFAEGVVEIPDEAELGELPALLREEYGEAAYRLLEAERPFGDWVVLINGRHHFVLQGMQTALADGDRVVLMPPVAGG
jgi:molybdopterin converting factor small subunit